MKLTDQSTNLYQSCQTKLPVCMARKCRTWHDVLSSEQSEETTVYSAYSSYHINHANFPFNILLQKYNLLGSDRVLDVFPINIFIRNGKMELFRFYFICSITSKKKYDKTDRSFFLRYNLIIFRKKNYVTHFFDW